MNFVQTIERLCAEWRDPRPAVHEGRLTEFNLKCTGSRNERSEVPRAISGVTVPDQLNLLYATYDLVRLFEDVEYGQWGLVLGSPDDVSQWTHAYRDYHGVEAEMDDLVIGQFLGDSDLLVVRARKAPRDHGNVLVALPLDKRVDWWRPAKSLDEFFSLYADYQGEKFWSRRS